MPNDPGIIATIISVCVAVGTFFIGRQTAAKSTGQEWGEFRSDLKHIIQCVEKLEENQGRSRAEILTYVDTRFREHMKNFHAKKENNT